MKITHFKELLVWQESMELTKEVYVLAEELPKKEQYGIIQQMQRASVSIPSNIAEGHNRHATKEFVYFLRIALGSAAELETQILLCEKLGFVSQQQIAPIVTRIERLGKMLRSMMTKLNAKTV